MPAMEPTGKDTTCHESRQNINEHELPSTKHCYIDRLPYELMDQILMDDVIQDHKTLYWRNELRLVNKLFAQLLAPTTFRDISICISDIWPLDYRGPGFQRRKCPSTNVPSNRIDYCTLYIHSEIVNDVSLVKWFRNPQKQVEFSHMFERIIALRLVTMLEECPTSRHAAIARNHNLILKALNKVEKLALDFSMVPKNFSSYVKGVHWPNLRHLELSNLQTTRYFLPDFLKNLYRPLEVLNLHSIRLPRPSSTWPEVFATLKTKHKLTHLRVWFGDFRHGVGVVNPSKMIEQVHAALGGRALVQYEVRWRSGPRYLVWYKDDHQHAEVPPPPWPRRRCQYNHTYKRLLFQFDEIEHRCKDRPVTSEQGLCTSCRQWKIMP